MANSRRRTSNPVQDNQDHPEMIDIFDDESTSDESDEDPSYSDDLVKAQSKFSELSIRNKSNSRNVRETDMEDEVMSPQKLSKEEMKSFEQIQKIIDSGQVEKLKVDQCKVYLRKHGLRLTGKKDILIQRIKEHTEILNGGGEVKYPPSSFVLNCKGDACLGDIVIFEQTVYEGHSIASRSAIGPPCGKRTIAGRIVNESYGAAKQQHTFTVEVLWSRGDKPLPPLHPLLIKGRNLYKLQTRRQKWEDEAERQRVLDEKHSRGSVARSYREARIQEKMAKKSVKGARVTSKNKENLCHQKDSKHAIPQTSLVEFENLGNVRQQHMMTSKTRQQQTKQDPSSKILIERKENSVPAQSRFQPSHNSKPSMKSHHSHQEPSQPRNKAGLDYRKQCSYPQEKQARHTQTMGSSSLYKENAEFVVRSPSRRPEVGRQHYVEYEERSFLPDVRHQSYNRQRSFVQANHMSELHSFEYQNLIASSRENLPFSDEYQSFPSIHSSTYRVHDPNKATHSPYRRDLHRDTVASEKYRHSSAAWQSHNLRRQQVKQLCRYYPQGNCHYGSQCKFLHETHRNYR